MGGGLIIKKVLYNIYKVPINNISDIVELFKDLVYCLGFSSHGNAFWEFPTPWNTGGVGITAIQSFTESYIAVDTWPEKNYANLFICSCKPFSNKIIKEIIEKKFPEAKVVCEILKEVKL